MEPFHNQEGHKNWHISIYQDTMQGSSWLPGKCRNYLWNENEDTLFNHGILSCPKGVRNIEVPMLYVLVPYCGKLSREKIFMNFSGLWATHESFLWAYRTHLCTCMWFAQHSAKINVSPQNAHFLPIRESLLPRKFHATWYYMQPLRFGEGGEKWDFEIPAQLMLSSNFLEGGGRGEGADEGR